MCWACRTHGRAEKFVQNLVGKREEKRPLGRPGRRWNKDGKVWTGFIWLRIATSGALL